MKPIFILLLLIFSTAPAFAALSEPAVVPVTTEAQKVPLERKAIEAHLGRKLRFSERILLGVAKRKARREARSANRSGPVDALAVVSFGLGIMSVLSVLLSSGFLFLLCGLGAIVTGVISLVGLSDKNDYKRGQGFAIAGIAIPISFTLLAILFIALLFSLD